MSSPHPLSFIFVPGAWHTPEIWNKVINQIEDQNSINNNRTHKCIPITLPSTQPTIDPRKITLLDDITAVRSVITSELDAGRNVVLVVHSYGGFVGACAVRGLTPPLSSSPPSSSAPVEEKRDNDGDAAAAGVDDKDDAGAKATATATAPPPAVIAMAMIATGFARLHTTFLAPFNNTPPPSWRLNDETGHAELVSDPNELFYHDLKAAPPVKKDDDRNNGEGGEDDNDNNDNYDDTNTQQHWTARLTPQASSVFTTGAEHVYPGWKDVPVLWYLATTEDRALPVEMQRVFVADAEAERIAASMGNGGGTDGNRDRDGGADRVVKWAHVVVREVASSHSPMLSRVQETVEFILATATAGVAAVEEKEGV